MSDFDKAFQIIIGAEGVYSNDPRDPGGETKYGVCKRDYPEIDIKNLTLDHAKQIYYDHYWIPIKGDSIPYPLNIFVFDAAVNQGVVTAIKMLQKALIVTQDGVLGRDTMAAVQRKTGNELNAIFMTERALRYVDSRNFDIYGRGWLKRLFRVSMEV